MADHAAAVLHLLVLTRSGDARRRIHNDDPLRQIAELMEQQAQTVTVLKEKGENTKTFLGLGDYGNAAKLAQNVNELQGQFQAMELKIATLTAGLLRNLKAQELSDADRTFESLKADARLDEDELLMELESVTPQQAAASAAPAPRPKTGSKMFGWLTGSS